MQSSIRASASSRLRSSQCSGWVDSLDLHTPEEALRGRPRQEFFHRRSFAGVSMDGFVGMLDDYMVWYRDRRIKTEFGMSIMDRRRRLGLVT